VKSSDRDNLDLSDGNFEIPDFGITNTQLKG